MVLKIMSGTLKGRQISLKDRMTIGQKRGDFLVQDSDIQSPHAQILKIDNQFSIQSVKGLKENILYNKNAVSFLVLHSGASFQLGSTLFQVENQNLSQINELKGISLFETHKQFSQTLDELSLSLEDEIRPMDILKKTFQVKIEKGTQKDEVWDIGYLPRKIGFTDSQLLLLDSHFKDIWFDLFLEKNKITFYTPYKEYILFNYKHLQKATLKNKDLVIIGSSYLRFYI